MSILPQLKRELSAAAHRLDRQRARRGWLRRGRGTLVAIPFALVGLGGLAFAAIHTLDTQHKPFADSQYRYGRCPAHVIALGPNALDLARLAAVRQSHTAYPHLRLRGTYSTDARVLIKGSARSADAAQCGLLGKTVLVDLHLATSPHSASMSQGAVYVSRVRPAGQPAGYLLWGLEH